MKPPKSNIRVKSAVGLEEAVSANLDAMSARLSRIDTCWTQLRRGLEGQAVEDFLRVYGEPVRRYLRGMTRGDQERAAELYQEFCVRLLKGRFRKACPEHGKFRHYLKRCLAALAADSWNKSADERVSAIPDGQEPAASPAESATNVEDEEYTAAWRQAVLAAALQTLAREEQRTPRGWYAVLKARLEAPEATSQQLATRLSAAGRPVSDGWVRKKLMEARGRFAELVMDEVARTLEYPSFDAVREELIDLGLWEYCRHYVEAAGGR
jgi:RNA polymerase sigma-70 factor (ECF subfamily)